MAKIHLRLFYKTDGILRVKLVNYLGNPVTGATGTHELVDADGGEIQSGNMTEEGNGWYYFNLGDDLAVSPNDILLAKITMTYGSNQCYGEYEVFVETDRR